MLYRQPTKRFISKQTGYEGVNELL